MTLEAELIQLIPSIKAVNEDEEIKGFYYSQTIHFNDFNKEVVEPGVEEDFPEGCLAIYADDDFYVVAILPYKFKDLPCLSIVNALWPEIKNPIILPDHGDYWWTAQRDQTLEVPGEPWELWFVEKHKKPIVQSILAQIPHFNPQTASEEDNYEAVRWRTVKTEEEAVAATSKIGGSGYIDDFESIHFEIRHWENGQRQVIRELPLDFTNFKLVSH